MMTIDKEQHMICNECETVAHCLKNGCVSKQQALDRMAENARELGLDYEQPSQLPTLSEFLQSSAENKAEVMERVIDKAIAMQQVKEKNSD
jgi:hypothetical protein